MKEILRYIQTFFYDVNKRVLVSVSVICAVLIYLNYHFLIDDSISKRSFIGNLTGRTIIFLIAFALPYLFYYLFAGRNYFKNPRFNFLLLFAPVLFSFKVAFDIPLQFSSNINWNNYWNTIFYWPMLVLIISMILLWLWRMFDRNQNFYGFRIKDMNWKPYWIMLLIMVPLVAAASTQPDFLEMYPKLKTIAGVYQEAGMHWWHKLIFELAYGSDFITIELFFRGFLILAFIKWAGKDAILPMACFYCTIHFGKPLGECISSFFGGLILGVVIYHTRTIFGGLMVHLGIAWMMELGGYLGNEFLQ